MDNPILFTLCIPTMDRFDDYLSKYLPQYIENSLIDEIIISDENGNDSKKILESFGENKKIKVYTNSKILGPFLNKIKVCQYAKNDWIALIDSDNFADENYFDVARERIVKNNYQKETIVCPEYPHSRIKISEDITFNKDTAIQLKSFLLDSKFLNTGNFVVNKYLIENLILTEEMKKEENCGYGYDVLYFFIILFKQYTKLNVFIIKDLVYIHNKLSDGYVQVSYKKNPEQFHSTGTKNKKELFEIFS